jgi:hypothetical protein
MSNTPKRYNNNNNDIKKAHVDCRQRSDGGEKKRVNWFVKKRDL